MQHHIILALAASGAYASLHKRQDGSDDIERQNSQVIQQACVLYDSFGRPDWSAPCNAIEAIVYQCQYGPEIFQQLNISYTSYGGENDSETLRRRTNLRRQIDDAPDAGSDSDPKELDPATQRTCICESQFFEQARGCVDCYRAHGGEQYASELGVGNITSISSSYCAATMTPTQGFASYFGGIVDATSSTASQTPISDPLANQTAVSLYFTASVTGTPAYIVAQATTMPASSSGNGTATVSYTSSNIVSGQIAPTASVNNEAASNGGSSGSESASGASGTAASVSSTGTSSAGAVETAAVKAGALGFVGFAAAVAML